MNISRLICAITATWGPARGKRDGVIRHISKRENGNWMKKIALLLDISIWHLVKLGKLGVNMNFR